FISSRYTFGDRTDLPSFPTRRSSDLAREERNKAKRSRLRTAIKSVHQADGTEAVAESFQKAKSLLDRAAARRLIHPNRAARLKSQLARVARSKGVEKV